MNLTAKIGDSESFNVILKWKKRLFTPGSKWDLVFTVKSDPNSQDDSERLFQKYSDFGITVEGSIATIEMLRADTFREEDFPEEGDPSFEAAPGIYYWDIQATCVEAGVDFGKVRTVANGTLELERDITRGASPSGPIYLEEEPVFRGASAYEVAVENGFIGTEGEWLASLVGEGSDLATSINAATSKPTPADEDRFAMTDSESSFALRKLTWANIKAAAKTYFDTLYAAIIHTHAVENIINVGHSKLLGRHGSGTGTAQEIGIDGGLELHGGNLRRAAVTGPVTIAAGGSVSAIADDALTIAMVSGLQDILNATASAEEVANKQDIITSATDLTFNSFNCLTGTIEDLHIVMSLTLDNALTIANGGTGSTTAAGARTNLGAQATLVSGTNIKTVNGNSLLGSGDVVISGGFSGTTNRITVGGNADSNLETTIGTSGTNATVNTVRLAVPSAVGTTNVNLLFEAKGTGAIIAGSMPDGTAIGGNARGAYAVDLQADRNNSTKVASGANSFVVGRRCTASGQVSIAMGEDNVSSGQGSTTLGGYGNLSSAAWSFSSGFYALATRHGQYSHAAGLFAAVGDAQRCDLVLRIKTTNATPTEMALDGSTARLTIPSGKVMSFIANITGIKSDGSAVAMFVRKGAIKNVAGTTTLVGSIETIGTDIEDNAATDVSITANNASDFLSIQVTGIAAETWRWVAHVEAVEIAYGT